MRIKPITVVAIVILGLAGAYFYLRNTTPPEPPLTIQKDVGQEADELSPSRTLGEGEKFVGAMGLYVTVPEGMRFRQDAPNERAANFYIESGPETNPDYQLYVVYQPSITRTEEGLEPNKKEMVAETIQEAVVGGHRGFEGLISGPKGRHHVIVLKDGHPLSFSTIPPTEENKAVSEQILSTISFE